jgi:hypothetical protein
MMPYVFPSSSQFPLLSVRYCTTNAISLKGPPGSVDGSLTLSGDFFTPNGVVDIVYDWGGGLYQQVRTASSSGQFTVIQGGIPWGDIPGHPGVGVIVTATDTVSGQYTTKSYSTPC